MKNIFIFLFSILSFLATAQTGGILFNAGIPYTDGPPTFNPGTKGSRLVVDYLAKKIYYHTSGTTWILYGNPLQEISGCSAPAYTPSGFQSDFVVNNCSPTPEIYFYTGSAWVLVNGASGGTTVTTDATLAGDGSGGTPLKIAQQSATSGQVLKWNGSTWLPAADNNTGTTYTAGTGIAISIGNVISNTSLNTDAQTLSFSSPNLSISGGNSVDLSALTPTTEQVQDIAGGMVSGNNETLITVTYDDPGGKINYSVTPTLSSYTNDAGFLTADADPSPTNELNTAFTVTGGNLRLTDPGGNLDVSVASIAPVQAVSAGAGISISGTTTRTITSTVTQADGSETAINAGTGISKTGLGTSGSPYVITNTGILAEVDGNPANELNTAFGISGANLRLTDPGGNIDVALTSIAPVQAISAGTGISVSAAPNITVTNTGDLSNTNELQTLSVAANAVTLSNSGGTFTLAGGGINTIGTAGSTITITGTVPVSTTSVVSANGFAGTVANATSNPAITMSTTITGVLKGNGTAISAASTSDGLVPSGGSDNQVLTKQSGTSYDYAWETPSGGGGGGVATVTGDAVDNTDAANPVVNAIPLDNTGLGLTGLAGGFIWKSSPGDFESGLVWDAFMSTTTGVISPYQGAFVWYSGASEASTRAFFQANGEEVYFQFGAETPGQTNGIVNASAGGIQIIANEFTGSRIRSITVGNDAVTSPIQFDNSDGGFVFTSTTGAFLPPRLTTTERDALTPSEGATIYNTTLHKTQTYDGSTWQSHW